MTQSRTTLAAAALVAILAVATGLRLWGIASHSLWVDEIASLEFSAGHRPGEYPFELNQIQRPGMSLADIPDAAAWTAVWQAHVNDTHPPLHALLLRAWREMFGSGDGVARGLSGLCSLVAILLLFDAARTLHGAVVALWAAAIMAVATSQITFAQEARGYTMLTMFILGAVAAMARIDRLGPSRLRAIGLGCSMLAAMMTHYLALPVGAALGVYALMALRGGARKWAVISLVSAAGVFLIACGPLLWSQRGNFSTNLAWAADDPPGSTLRTMGRLASLPLRFFITPRGSDEGGLVARLGAVLYLAAVLAVWRRDLRIWAILALTVIGITAISDLLAERKTLEYLRFTVVAAPAMFALLAAVGTKLPRRWMMHALPAAAVVGCLAALPEAYNQYWKFDYRPLAAAFDRSAGPNDLIVSAWSDRQRDWPDAALIAAVVHYSAHPHRPILVLSQPISEQMRATVMHDQAAWYFTAAWPSRVDSVLPGAVLVDRGGVPLAGSFGRITWPEAAPRSRP